MTAAKVLMPNPAGALVLEACEGAEALADFMDRRAALLLFSPSFGLAGARLGLIRFACAVECQPVRFDALARHAAGEGRGKDRARGWAS